MAESTNNEDRMTTKKRQTICRASSRSSKACWRPRKKNGKIVLEGAEFGHRRAGTGQQAAWISCLKCWNRWALRSRWRKTDDPLAEVPLIDVEDPDLAEIQDIPDEEVPDTDTLAEGLAIDDPVQDVPEGDRPGAAAHPG